MIADHRTAHDVGKMPDHSAFANGTVIIDKGTWVYKIASPIPRPTGRSGRASQGGGFKACGFIEFSIEHTDFFFMPVAGDRRQRKCLISPEKLLCDLF